MKSVKQNYFLYIVIAGLMCAIAILLARWPNAKAVCEAEPMVVEPEVIVIHSEPEEETPPPAFYSDFSEMTDGERGLLAMVVYRECRGQERDGQKAVVEVVLNRVRNPEFPNTITEVVYQKYNGRYQFSCAPSLTTQSIKELNCLSYAFGVVDEVLEETDTVIPDRYLFFSTKAPGHNDYMKIGDHYFR